MKRLERASSFLAAVVFGVALAPAATAATIDLRKHDEPKLVGTWRQSGMNWVAPAGDVNGDGEPDVIFSGTGGVFARGVIRIFFGPLPPGTTSLGETPSRGFSIYGQGPDDFATGSAAGDVNGDGLDDIVVGAALADNGRGRSYVIFGKAEGGDVELASFDGAVQGEGGFRIDNAPAWEVGKAGDTDGDGLADFFLNGRSDRVYVVRGKTDTLPMNLTTFDYGVQGDAGYRISYVSERGGVSSVAFAGDANGDGVGDLAFTTEGRRAGRDAYVVFGKPDGSEVDATALGDGGYFIDGGAGRGVSSAGDANGDGRDDLVVGEGDSTAYLVFGQAETSKISLSDLGTHGYRIVGKPEAPGSYGSTGAFVAGGVDMNADGLSDFLVTDYQADHRGREDSGSVYLLFGKAGTKPIRLAKLGPRGIRIDGEVAGDLLGIKPAMPGDVTDDGLPDLVLGAAGVRTEKVHVLSHRMLFP